MGENFSLQRDAHLEIKESRQNLGDATTLGVGNCRVPRRIRSNSVVWEYYWGKLSIAEYSPNAEGNSIDALRGNAHPEMKEIRANT